MTQIISAPMVQAPATFSSNEPGAFIEALRSPWYSMIGALHDTLQRATMQYAHDQGLKGLWLPSTTRTITCPTALGSDTEGVRVTVGKVDTYLADSMQFLLEYGMRLAPGGCYSILPTYRNEVPDRSHLNQFTHSEAEIPGGLEDLVQYVEGYVRRLASAVLDEHGDQLAKARGSVEHLERMTRRSEPFARVTLDEAIRIVKDTDGAVVDDGRSRVLTRVGEHLLMERVDEFVWVTHHDALAVPFYQAFDGDDETTARCADLFFGVGEVVGSGERHADPTTLRRSMALHGVAEEDYDWYLRLREDIPMQTSGFGMGMDRFLMWVLNHDDVRDIPLVSRVDEPEGWPNAVVRP